MSLEMTCTHASTEEETWGMAAYKLDVGDSSVRGRNNISSNKRGNKNSSSSSSSWGSTGSSLYQETSVREGHAAAAAATQLAGAAEGAHTGLLGSIYVVVDDSYQGLPFTSLIR